MGMLSRRVFVASAGAAGLGLVAGCGPLPWVGTPQARVPRVGYLTDSDDLTAFEFFRDAMRDLGYVEGQSVIFEYRDPKGNPERLAEYAAELVHLPVAVIVAGTAIETRAAMRATSTIPIVMGIAPDPVAQGLVDSLSHPGGNVTGPSALMRQLAGKRLELLKEATPGLSRAALLGVRSMNTEVVREAATALGIRLMLVEVDGPDDFSGAFAAAQQAGAEGIVTQPHPILTNNGSRLVEEAAVSRLPVMYESRRYVVLGGLMAYGASPAGLRRRGAYYVDRILKGAKPADLPVEQPMTFDFVVNLKTAQAVGITFPNDIMLQVTEVIQ